MRSTPSEEPFNVLDELLGGEGGNYRFFEGVHYAPEMLVGLSKSLLNLSYSATNFALNIYMREEDIKVFEIVLLGAAPVLPTGS